ncbi:hypothetical protein LZ31DRAFT_149890 [Colletotrichum somersetense]|nr:hypothetical protein LZ31DRAFT_149890 [Colletotrichum somersetense]
MISPGSISTFPDPSRRRPSRGQCALPPLLRSDTTNPPPHGHPVRQVFNLGCDQLDNLRSKDLARRILGIAASEAFSSQAFTLDFLTASFRRQPLATCIPYRRLTNIACFSLFFPRHTIASVCSFADNAFVGELCGGPSPLTHPDRSSVHTTPTIFSATQQG